MRATAFAQLCAGNLGDPIIHIDFGDGHSGNLGSAVSGYKHAYGCPKKGEYSLSNFLFGCENSTWLALTGDHGRTTLDGNYMLVNGASLDGDVIVDTVTGLCANTTYEFATWAANVMKFTACENHPALANLTLSVETITGILLGTSNTGNLPILNERNWKQYGVFFTTPPDVNAVVLKIKSNTVTECGAAFSLDDITLRACGPTIKATVESFDTSVINLCADYTQPIVIHASFESVFADPLMQWQYSLDSGFTWIDIAGETTTTYTMPRRDNGVIVYRMVIAERINFSSPRCRISSNIIWTNVHPLPEHQPTRYLIGCLGKDYTFASPVTYALRYLWQGPHGFFSTSANPVIPDFSYADTGIYSVMLTVDFGCTVKDSFYLRAFPATTINAVTEYNMCEGNPIRLSASGQGSFVWTPSTALSNDHIPNPFANPSVSTQYKVVLTNTYGCKDSAFVNVHVNKKLVLSAGRDKQILVGDTAILDASISGTGVEYFWTPPDYISDVKTINPIVFPPYSTDYTIYANSTVGCGNKSLTVKVKVLNEFNIPSAFTPNGDGKNDVFRIPALDNYTVDKFLIFNRWGKLIFQTNDAYKGWDGTVGNYPQQSGTYTFYLMMHSKTGTPIVRKGTIVLVR